MNCTIRKAFTKNHYYTNRQSPCRVSIGRARADQGVSTGQERGSRAGAGEGEPVTGPRKRARRASLRGGPILPRMIIPGADSVLTRCRAL